LLLPPVKDVRRHSTLLRSRSAAVGFVVGADPVGVLLLT
jgi:hypothetical protein